MHFAWCCVSVLKYDPKIPKSRDRRPKFSRCIEITEGYKIQEAGKKKSSVIYIRPWKTEECWTSRKLQGSIERKSEDPFQHSTQHSVDILVWRRRSPFTFVEDRDLKIRKVQLVGLETVLSFHFRTSRPLLVGRGPGTSRPQSGQCCWFPSLYAHTNWNISPASFSFSILKAISVA